MQLALLTEVNEQTEQHLGLLQLLVEDQGRLGQWYATIEVLVQNDASFFTVLQFLRNSMKKEAARYVETSVTTP